MTLDSSGNLGIGTTSPGSFDGTVKTVIGGGSGGPVLTLYGGNATFSAINFADGTTGNEKYRGFLEYDHASDALRIGTAGATKATLDSSGNLGLGVTPSAWRSTDVAFQVRRASLWDDNNNAMYLGQNVYENTSGNYIYIGSDYASAYRQQDGTHAWFYAASGTAGNTITFTQAMTLDASGNLGVGISPTTRLHVSTSAQAIGTFNSTAANGGYLAFATSSTEIGYIGTSVTLGSGANNDLGVRSQNNLMFYTNGGNERARITSGGDLLVNTTTAAGKLTVLQATNGSYAGALQHSNTSPYGLQINYTNATPPNNTTNRFIDCEDTGGFRFQVRSNGGIANYQANNVDLSDARTKKEINPAASMWDKIGALEIVTYKYNDQTHDDVNVGVIAQQVESVEPVWVDADGFGDTPEDGVPLKTVYTKDIYFAAIKALQEAMARIEQLESKVAALESK